MKKRTRAADRAYSLARKYATRYAVQITASLVFVACMSVMSCSVAWAMNSDQLAQHRARDLVVLAISCAQAVERSSSETAIALLQAHQKDEKAWTILKKNLVVAAIKQEKESLLQAIKPHLNSQATGCGLDSLLADAYQNNNADLAQAVVKNGLCAFLRKKSTRGTDKEETCPFIEMGNNSLKAWLRIKFCQTQDSTWAFDMNNDFIPTYEMDEWEIVPANSDQK